MSGETNLSTLLATMAPTLLEDEYIFCTMPNKQYGDLAHLLPLATFQETEGLTLVIPRQQADTLNITYDVVFRCITLTIHSSLEAVGLTAAVATKLAEQGLSANVIAAFYHDHIFVQADKADKAMSALHEFTM